MVMWTHYNMNNNKENHLLVSSLKMGTSFASRNLLSLLIIRNVVILMFLHFWNMWKIARFVMLNPDCLKILQRQSEVSIVLLLTCLRIFKDIYSEVTEIYTWCDNYTCIWSTLQIIYFTFTNMSHMVLCFADSSFSISG